MKFIHLNYVTRHLGQRVSSESRREEVAGGAVEVVPAAVVPPRRPWVGVAEGVLDVLQRRTEAEGLGGVGVPEAVRGDPDGEAGLAAGPGDLLVGGLVAVPAFAVAAGEDATDGA